MWLCLQRLTAHFTIAPEDAVSARYQFALITRGVVHEAYGARIGTLITVQEAGAMILGTFLLCARRVTRTPAHMGSPSSRRITISHPIQGSLPAILSRVETGPLADGVGQGLGVSGSHRYFSSSLIISAGSPS